MVVIEIANGSNTSYEVRVLWDGRGSTHGLTRENGRVTFDVRPGSGKIYVDGRKVHEGYISRLTRVQPR